MHACVGIHSHVCPFRVGRSHHSFACLPRALSTDDDGSTITTNDAAGGGSGSGVGAANAGENGCVGSGNSEEEDKALRRELEALGNHIRFFKNGKDQGPAYQQLIGGAALFLFQMWISSRREAPSSCLHHQLRTQNNTTAKYYPAVSLYNTGGRVRANFGPAWICDPREHGCRIDFRPLSALREPPAQQPPAQRKEEAQAYQAFIAERRAAWRARHATAAAAAAAREPQGQGQGQGQEGGAAAPE